MYKPYQYYYYTDSRRIAAHLLEGIVAEAVPVTMRVMRLNCMDLAEWPVRVNYPLDRVRKLNTLALDDDIKFFRSKLLGRRVYCLGWKDRIYVWRRK